MAVDPPPPEHPPAGGAAGRPGVGKPGKDPAASGGRAAAASGGKLPPAVAVGTSRAERLRRERVRGLRIGLPSMLLSLLLHAAGIGLVVHFATGGEPVVESERVLRAAVDAVEHVEPPPIEPPPPLEEPELPPVEVPEALLDASTPTTDDSLPPALRDDALGLGAAGRLGGSGGQRGGAAWGLPDGIMPAGDLGSPFRLFVDDLRVRGLDLVIVLDATGSMQRFIDRAREALDGIIDDLALVVPSLRIGLVAYRDLADDWVTRRLDLNADRYRIHDFLLQLEAAGGQRQGADFEEAVEVGLAVAVGQSSWRPEARRVILLVGDAPYHEEDQQAALATVRDFVRGGDALLNTIYVGDPGEQRPTENQLRARSVLARLAEIGDGLAFSLSVDDPSAVETLRRNVSEATFGDAWAEEIASLQAAAPADARAASVRRHVTRMDRRWLLDHMRDEPLHPHVPDACIELFDGRIAAAMVAQVEDESLPPDLRSAALYVLRRSLEDVRRLPLDVDLPLDAQQPSLAALKHDVRQVPGAARFLDGADPLAPQDAALPPPPVVPSSAGALPASPPPASDG